jgi:hypothetical protein
MFSLRLLRWRASRVRPAESTPRSMRRQSTDRRLQCGELTTAGYDFEQFKDAQV